jgi:GTP-binding protein
MQAVLLNPPKEFNRGVVKVLYANQVETKPPLFVLFVNSSKHLHFSYRRYLENKIREAFDFEGTPIVFKLKEKSE